MFARRFWPVLFLVACGTPFDGERPEETVEYDYVHGYNPDLGETIWGGAHHVVDYSENYREAISTANQTTKIHPELKGDHAKFDASLDQGTSDWDVFASNWWPQSKNGTAWRWLDGDDADYADHDELDTLSPVEKYDFLFNTGQTATVAAVKHWNYEELLEDEGDRPDQHEHPEVEVMGPATQWEMTNHGMYNDDHHPDSWWGHCNGWASYVTTEPSGAPQRDIRVKIDDGEVIECAADDTGCVLVRMGDIEALMSEMYFNDQATFGGQRCNTRPDEMERDEWGRPTDPKCRDLNPGSWHIAIVGLLNRGATHMGSDQMMKPAFIIDHNYDYQVWNFPVVRYQITQSEAVTREQAAQLVGEQSEYEWNAAAKRFQRVQMTYYMVSDSVGVSEMLKQAGSRNVPLHPVRLNYVLEMDDADTIVGGEWIADPDTTWGGDDNDSKQLHPDFLWMGVDHKGYWESEDDTGGWSDNPHISYVFVKALLDCANDASTCKGPESPADPGPVDSDLSCEDSCGGSVTVGDATCWCDDMCAQYGDCCEDKVQYCDTDDGGSSGGTATATCDDSCGSSSPVTAGDTTCYCDEACSSYGDCCDDYSDVCN